MKRSSRNATQHHAYAMERASLALDRMVRARTSDEWKKARRWALAWSAIANIKPLWEDGTNTRKSPDR
jgi:hypothetical protein